MKFIFFTDVHWSQNASIVRGRGDKYSVRLENLIQSLNWVENLALQTSCNFVVCGGDFFDSSQLNSEEVSALKEIKWNGLPHYFITGNHEASTSSLEFSTLDVFSLCPNSIVISKPETYNIQNIQYCFLPFITEKDRQPLETYFSAYNSETKRIIVSHNDLKNVQYGGFLSTVGFNIEEIDKNCDLFLNGHIHTCGWVNDKILDGGNLTGQNFTEDSFKNKHCVQVIDTDTMQIQFYENPYALKFYKVLCRNKKEIDDFCNNYASRYAVITMTVPNNLIDYVKECLKQNSAAFRILVDTDTIKKQLNVDMDQFQGVDHLQQFRSYVEATYGLSDIYKEELEAVLR